MSNFKLCQANCNCSSSEERVLHVELQGFLVHNNVCPTYSMSKLIYTLPRFRVLQCLILVHYCVLHTLTIRSAEGKTCQVRPVIMGTTEWALNYFAPYALTCSNAEAHV